jgi:glycosyltransferase involved in cell wall biosynthesis
MHIGLLTLGDCNDVGYWSGTPSNMSLALQKSGHEISHLGPLHAPFLLPLKVVSHLRSVVGGAKDNPIYSQRIGAQYARNAMQRVLGVKPEALMVIAGSVFAGQIPHGIPMVYASDATFRVLVDYHPKYRAMSLRARNIADEMEASSLRRADLVIYPSDWAARSAVRDYSVDPAKVHVIPWGANCDAPAAIADRRQGRATPFRLLFVGVNWQGKGAAIAVDTLNALRAMGVPAELTICGCTPPNSVNAPGLTIIPFLDKNDPDQLRRLRQLYTDADLFILPTRADCYGIAFCEAAAFGVPSLAPDTGGVPSAVADGLNGILLPSSADGMAYADVAATLFRDPERLAALRTSSRKRSEDVLNWGAWATQLSRLMELL